MSEKEQTANLNPDKILIAEFNYAQDTASQAMDDRHKVVNFFLLISGVLFNALLLILKDELLEKKLTDYSISLRIVVSVFFMAIFIIGLLYLLKLVKLRLSWYNSALCMNNIKDYYDENLYSFELKNKAFLWNGEKLKKWNLGKLSTIFGYSAILIVLIDSLALGGSVAFVCKNYVIPVPFFVFIFVFQIMFYKALIAKGKKELDESQYKKE